MKSKTLLCGVGLALIAGLAACGKKSEAPAAHTEAAPEHAAPHTSPSAPAAASHETMTEAGSADTNARTFGIEAGRVEYDVSGAETGSETLTWDSWGNRMAIVTKAKLGALPVEKTTLVTLDKVIIVDNVAKSGASMANPMKDLMAGGGSTDDLADRMMVKLGATRQGTESVLGRTCTKYVSSASSTCVWQGIALKTEISVNGLATTKVATNIQENVTPDPAVFDVPAGTTVQDVSTMAPTAQAGPKPAAGAPPPGSPNAPAEKVGPPLNSQPPPPGGGH